MWSDIVKKSVTSTALFVAIVPKAVRSTVEENVRSSNFIIYCGLENSANLACRLFNEIGAFPKPEILTATRVGTQKSLENASSRKPRPIKVTLANLEAVKFVLNRARKLRRKKYEHWSCVYLAPDRSKEERVAQE